MTWQDDILTVRLKEGYSDSDIEESWMEVFPQWHWKDAVPFLTVRQKGVYFNSEAEVRFTKAIASVRLKNAISTIRLQGRQWYWMEAISTIRLNGGCFNIEAEVKFNEAFATVRLNGGFFKDVVAGMMLFRRWGWSDAFLWSEPTVLWLKSEVSPLICLMPEVSQLLSDLNQNWAHWSLSHA